MKPEKQGKFWKIECTQHTATIFQTKIKAGYLSEKALLDFMRILLCKYALNDDEILEECKKLSFKSAKRVISIERENNLSNGILSISFSAQLADICVTAWLI